MLMDENTLPEKRRQTPGKVNYFKYFNRYTCDNIPSKYDMTCIEITVF